MKLIAVILLVGCLQVSAKVSAQKITLNEQNVSLKKVFRQIEKQSDYYFVYRNEWLRQAGNVDVNLNDATIEQTMDSILKGQSLSYSIVDNNIVIQVDNNIVIQEDSISKTTEQQLKAIPINGSVIDSATGEPLAGVSIKVKGTAIGTITDTKGKFSLDVEDDAVLVISYLGYISKEIAIEGRTSIHISLSATATDLNQLVVVGYGEVSKRNLTSAVSTVSGDVLNSYPSVSIAHSLQGRAAGVFVQQNNGQPGSGVHIRIRGQNSIVGSNEPLWIIDGFPGNPSLLNPSEVKNISVLKDAAATAIYGSRGANGVIIVTTKQGRKGNIQINFNNSMGIQVFTNKLDVLNARQYMKFVNEKSTARGGVEAFTDQEISGFKGKGTNWQDEIFHPALIQNHSLSISGGTKKVQSRVGFSYSNQDGIIINSGYSRFSLDAYVNYNLSDVFTWTSNITLSHRSQDKMDSQGSSQSTIAISIMAPPTASPKYPDGTWNDFQDAPIAPMNPLAYLNEVSNLWKANSIIANTALTIKPIDGLSIKISGHVTHSNNRLDHYKTLDFPSSSGVAGISLGNHLDLYSSNNITYKKVYNNKHHLTVMLGNTFDRSIDKAVNTGTAKGFLSDVTKTYDIGSAQQVGIPSSGYSGWSMMSFFGRLRYSFDNRYYLTANFRADGSSRFSTGNKWGYFPSVAVAWRISNEEFLKDVDWLSNLKFRASYGVTGNTAISPYATLNLLSTGLTVFDKSEVTAFSPSDDFHNDLIWELTKSSNVGLNFALFDNRMRIATDYYYKKTTGLISRVEMARSTGYTSALQNIGSLQNQGFEFKLDARIIAGRRWNWNFGVNFSLNRNKVLSLADGKDIYGSSIGSPLISGQLNLVRVGEPVGVFYGYMENGYDEENGHIVYKDLKGDGNIDANDRNIIGNPNPDYLLNFNTAINYKNFNLSLFFINVMGPDIFSLSMVTHAYDYLYNGNTLADVLNNYWTKNNTNAKYPGLTQGAYLLSDRFVYDGSYLRLKNIVLSYSIPVKRIKWLRKARVFISAQNLFTITTYPFWDPSIQAYGGSNILKGIDSDNYPRPKVFTAGINVSF